MNDKTYKNGNKVVISGGRPGKEGDKDFITLKSGIYWWHAVVVDVDWCPEGWTPGTLIRVKYNDEYDAVKHGQVHTEEQAMEYINRRDAIQRAADRMTPIETKVARYSFNMDADEMLSKLEYLNTQVSFSQLTERANKDLVEEYNCLLETYKRMYPYHNTGGDN